MRTAPPTDPAPLLHLTEMASKGELDTLIFTSALGVDKLFEIAKPAKSGIDKSDSNWSKNR